MGASCEFLSAFMGEEMGWDGMGWHGAMLMMENG